MVDLVSKKIDELDPASTLAIGDRLPVSQSGTTRRATVEQVRAGLVTTAALNSHTSNTSNPHNTTASQVGAFTTQQTTAAIATAQTTVQNNLNSHTGNTSNPHNTTAAQVGAMTTAQTNSAIATAQTTVQNNLNSHTSNTSNPHAVTADQVGRTINQWNANQIQYRPINIPSPAPDGAVLVYSAPDNAFTLATIAANAPPHLLGAITQVPYAVPAGLYTDENSWLWYPAIGQSIGRTGSTAAIADDRLSKLYFKLWENVDVVSGWIVRNAAGNQVVKGASAIADWTANRIVDIPNMSGRVAIASGAASGLTTRAVGTTGGAENTTIGLSNLPEIPFRRNSGVAGGSPFSITADNNKGGYDANSTGAINVGSANTPISRLPPFKVYSELWFTGARA